MVNTKSFELIPPFSHLSRH